MTTSASATKIWPTFLYNDARAAIDFLETALGFTTSLVVPNPDDENVVEHCQMNGPEGGGIMLGTANRPGNKFSERPIGGCSSAYVVVVAIDALYERAVAAGAEKYAAATAGQRRSHGRTATNIYTHSPCAHRERMLRRAAPDRGRRGAHSAHPTRRRPDGHGAGAWHFGGIGGHRTRKTAGLRRAPFSSRGSINSGVCGSRRQTSNVNHVEGCHWLSE